MPRVITNLHTGPLQPADLRMRIFGKHFERLELNGRPAIEEVADRLFPAPNLKEMVVRGFFNGSYLGTAIDVGTNDTSISFEQGLKNLWARKLRIIRGGDYAAAKAKADEAARNYKYADSERLGIVEYRARYFSENLEEIMGVFAPRAGSKLAVGMASLCDQNTFVSYTINELMPEGYNAFARAFLYEKFLSNAGTLYMSYFPAIYDSVFSYGPFQFTGPAVADVNAQGWMRGKLPANLSGIWGMDAHAKAAIAFALLNLQRCAARIRGNGAAERMMAIVERLPESEEGMLKSRAFMAGLVGAMHNNPSKAVGGILDFLVGGDLANPHASCPDFISDEQVKQYFRMSAEIYLALKDYSELKAKYS